MIFRNWILENFPFLEDDFDALTDYELFCKMIEYMKDALKTLDKYDEKLIAFNNRLTAIENYIDNLDIQDEVNNKLDEMYENGQLQSLIEQFIDLQVVFNYDNVSSMKLATNLVAGGYAQTRGYYESNDGGASIYKVRTVTNDDVIDDKYIIALYDDTLVAELLFNNSININQLGANNESDIALLINEAIDKNINIFNFEKQNYVCETAIVINNKKCIFNFNNAEVSATASKMFEITNDNLHKVFINDLIVTGLDTNKFIEINPSGSWGCTIELNNDEINKFLILIDAKSLFNSVINNCQFRSDYGYFSIIPATADSGNMSNNNVFNNCYIRGYSKVVANYPDYKFVLNKVKSMQFHSCCFADCKTLFNLTSCEKINLDFCEVEDVTNVCDSRIGLFANEVMLINVTKYCSSDTYHNLPHSYLQSNIIKANVSDASLRYSILQDSTLPEYLSYAYNNNNKYVNLTSIKSNAIKYYIPVNIIENKANSVSSLTTTVSSIFQEQANESTLVTVYTKLTGSTDGGAIYFKDEYICKHNTAIYHVGQTILYDSTWSSAQVHGATVSNTLTQYSLSTTSSASGNIDVRVKFEKIGTAF